MKRTRGKPTRRKAVSTKTMWQVAEKHDGPSILDPILPDVPPPWVKELGKIFLRTILPGVKIRGGMESDPDFLGALLARAVISQQFTEGQLQMPAKSIEDLNTFFQKHKASKALSKAQVKRATAVLVNEIASQASVINQMMQLMPRLEVQEQERFLKGYNRTLKFGVEMVDPARVPVEHKIIQTFFLQWQLVARMKSVSDVHRFLVRTCAKPGVTISRERIAKLCHTIGLRFRGRGRPPKTGK
jgi:hypothetical protein